MTREESDTLRADVEAKWGVPPDQRPPLSPVTAEEVAEAERRIAAGEFKGGEGAPGLWALIEELERGGK